MQACVQRSTVMADRRAMLWTATAAALCVSHECIGDGCPRCCSFPRLDPDHQCLPATSPPAGHLRPYHEHQQPKAAAAAQAAGPRRLRQRIPWYVRGLGSERGAPGVIAEQHVNAMALQQSRGGCKCGMARLSTIHTGPKRVMPQLGAQPTRHSDLVIRKPHACALPWA